MSEIQNSVEPTTHPTAKSKMNKQFLLMLVAVTGILLSCSKQQADYSLIPVKSGESWGYVNPKGEYVINPQFAEADFFRDGLAYVKSSEGKVGYIGTDGKYAIAAEYKEGTPFSEGLAFVVAYGGAPVCIDKKGNKKFELQQAKRVEWFAEGLAVFTTADGKSGFVDKSGKVVINPQFGYAYSFSEGLALVLQDGKYGYIDKTGKIVISAQFEAASSFHGGKANFTNGKKYGFIDKKGNYVINPQFEYASLFYGGLGLVKSGDKWGYIAESGEIVINPQFDNADIFQNGLAPFRQNGSWGFIDKKGKIVINPQFDRASVFYGNMAFVKSGKQWGIIDKNGKYTVNPQFDEIKDNIYLDLKLMWCYVTSDFYDTSELIGEFFKRAEGNSFDGIDASFTLQNLLDNKIYGDGVKVSYDSPYVVEYKKSQKLTSDISISKVSFGGYGAFYTESYYNKAYNFDTKINGMTYEFYLTGEARSKGIAITNALSAEIQKRYNIKLEHFKDESGDSDTEWYGGENDTFGIWVTPKSDRIIELRIGFKNE
jgi:hypothetical protein